MSSSLLLEGTCIFRRIRALSMGSCSFRGCTACTYSGCHLHPFYIPPTQKGHAEQTDACQDISMPLWLSH